MLSLPLPVGAFVFKLAGVDGTLALLTAGVDRFTSFVTVGMPIVNQHNGIQSKPDYRVLTGIGARLN